VTRPRREYAIVIATAGVLLAMGIPAIQRGAGLDVIGLALFREGQGCLAISHPGIAAGTRVVLAEQPADGPATIKPAVTGERLMEPCDDGMKNPNARGNVASFYRVSMRGGVAPPETVVLAIVNPTGPVTVRAGKLEADLDGDSVNEAFRFCTSTEHLHFMVWTGAPGQGRPRWHGSYYAGYDMTPSCTTQDIAGMEALQQGGRLELP
jgi:hypothetical protein